MSYVHQRGQIMVHVYGYCVAVHCSGTATAYCACGWSTTCGTQKAATDAVETHNAEQAAEARRCDLAKLIRKVLDQKERAR
ncbi:hypothetical protein [Amycolatopsis sp. H20-H5]|uniref:hypothetical protein n=1 Tax=Amycolatopsis sp. H20-H5 TaxID=3046309 RepID=UPI002DBA5B58|nr:hypothetical protein [Amycolatopsis sp. H20-H5]MEC3974938.1 hypothetical protein [Amycolatopsis sp. H20-H5]